MDVEEALVLLNDWLVEKTGQPLTPIEKQILRGNWHGETYYQMEIGGYSPTYIQVTIAPQLWRRLSQLTVDEVTKKNMQSVLMTELEKRSRSHPLQQSQPSQQKTEEDLKQYLSLLDEWFREKAGRHLSYLEKKVVQGVWLKDNYSRIANQSCYSESAIKAAASRLWKIISELIGEEVTKANLRSVTERVLKTRSLSPPLQQFDLESQKQVKPHSYQDWGDSPDISNFYGRTKELETLEQLIIKDQCRVIEIAGIGGIGKTTLVTKLATQIQDQFEFVIWRSLFSSPPIKNILTELIEFFSQQHQPNLPQDSSSLISKIIEYLRSHRALVILDNVESILQPGELAGSYRQGYEDYGYLIKQVGETLHQSCLIITSREQLREIALRQEGSSPVRSLILQGLDKNAAMQILSNRGLLDQEQWGALIDLCNGNPLALQLATGTIKWVFGGYVSNFLEMEAFTFNFDGFLDRQFERLSSLEKQIVSVIAMTSNAITIRELQEQLQPKVSPSELIKAIQSLLMRSLITRLMNEKEPFFTLHPLLKKYVKDRD